MYNKTLPASSKLLLGWLLFALGCSSPERYDTAPTRQGSDTSLYNFNNKDVSEKVPINKHVRGEHYVAVNIRDMKFNPEIVTVKRGDTVEWINNDLTTHCVSEINKAWTSSAIKSGSSWEKVITETADYYCAIHLVMKGKVQVR